MTELASAKIDKLIADLGDWKQELFVSLRRLILASSPQIREEWKWNTAVWAEQGLVCSIAVFKNHLKLNFFEGASLPDPAGLLNAGLEAKASRSIDFRENSPKLQEPALQSLLKAAVELNRSAGNHP